MKVFWLRKRSWLVLLCLGVGCLFWSFAVLQHHRNSLSAFVTNKAEEPLRTRGDVELSFLTTQSASSGADLHSKAVTLDSNDTNTIDLDDGVGSQKTSQNDSALDAVDVENWKRLPLSSTVSNATEPGEAKLGRVESVYPDAADIADTSEEGKVYSSCQPHHRVVFLKVHKAASSTVTNVLQRFGFTRNLSFVLPNREPHSAGYNYISHFGTPIEPSRDIIPPPPSPLGGRQDFDILCNHAVYDRNAFRSFMPHDSVYITILRDPFQQFVSAFAYYRAWGKSKRNNSQEQASLQSRMSAYLHEETANHRGYPRFGLLNMQSRDLGMMARHILNASLRREYLQQLGRDFQLVMLVEFFDESIVLLRRLLCWSMKDVLYISKNKNAHKPHLAFSAEDRAKHRQLAVADYDLYGFFRAKFLRILAAQKEDFTWEVNLFKQVLQDVTAFCDRFAKIKCNRETEGLHIAQSPWNEQFVVTCQDCQLLQLRELRFLDKLLAARLAVGDLMPSPAVTK